MSLRKFIELYSGNRDRNLYPITSDFTVPFAASTQNITPEEAKDAMATVYSADQLRELLLG